MGPGPSDPMAFASALYPGRCLAIELADPCIPPGTTEWEIPMDQRLGLQRGLSLAPLAQEEVL